MESKDNIGYDAKREEYVDMLKAGIIDPKKVTRIALENAASVAGMILTTECAVVEIIEEKPAAMPPMGGGGMQMSRSQPLTRMPKGRSAGSVRSTALSRKSYGSKALSLIHI